MPSRLRIALASILSVAALGAIAPAANAYVYYSKGYGDIGRAGNDGANPNTTENKYFLTGPEVSFPAGVAVDSTYIYWVNTGTGTIGRARLNGTERNAAFIAGADVGSGPIGLAVNSTHIYWTRPDAPGGGSIGRANINGSSPNASFITGAGLPYGIALTPNYLYWGGNAAVGRAQLSGGDSQPNFIATGTGQTTQGLAVDSSHIYIGYGSTKIGRFDLDGSNPTPDFITGQSTVTGLALNSSHIYWGGQYNAIGRAQLDGSNPDPFFLQPATDGNTSFAAIDSLPRPTIVSAAKPTKTYLKVRVGCGDAYSCTLDLSGVKVGGAATLTPRTVSIPAGTKPVLKFTYSAALRRSLAKGGSVKVTARNQVSTGTRSLTLRVAK